MSLNNTDVAAERLPLNRMNLWPNDDLLFDERIRNRINHDFPGMLRVLDWPALRAVFTAFDGTATRSRRRRQRIAFFAVAVAGLGAMLSAALPLVELFGGNVVRWAFAASAGLSAFGFAWTVVLIIFSPDKSLWLEHRLRTERLRQFYFQFMIAKPTLAVKAMTDDSALAEWHRDQAIALSLFQSYSDRLQSADLVAIIEDVNDKGIWQMRDWEHAPLLPDRSDDLDTYFLMLRRQRIGIQLRYVQEKLAPGFGSPETRLKAAQLVAQVSTASALLLSAAAAIVLFREGTTSDIVFRTLTSAVALLGAIVMVVKVMSDGLQLKPDVDRYLWYRAAISDIDARFNDPEPANRLRLLRDLERVAYREMREFLTVHDKAGFSLA